MDQSTLSKAELDILLLIAEGFTDKEIAAARGKSLETVHCHRDHILAKTGCRNRVELTRYSVNAGLVPSEWKRSKK